MMRYSLCVTTEEVDKEIPLALLRGTFIEKLQTASQLGYDGVELMVTDARLLDGGHIASCIAEQGLVISAISTGAIVKERGISLLSSQREEEGDAIECLMGLIAFAQRCQAPIVTIGSFRGRAAYQASRAGVEQRFASILFEAAQEARQKGVRLALEPINRCDTDFIHTVEEVWHYIDLIGSDVVGVLLDTYHIAMDGLDIEETVGKACRNGNLLHVHVADTGRAIVSRGSFDFKTFFTSLRLHKYDTFLSAELFHGNDGNKAAALTIEALRQIESECIR
jgi:sugar phosphate isomerase/epimerase